MEKRPLVSTVVSGKEEEGAKFRDYFDHHEPIATVPSHRALAMFRGRNEGVLQLSLNADPQFDEPPKESHGEQIIIDHLGLRLNNAPADSWRKGVVSWTWRIKVLMHLETELMGTVRERAEDEAINVFARNLHDLLMAAPAGLRATMGLDPGLRTGVKVAVVDATGKLVATDTIYPHTGQPPKRPSPSPRCVRSTTLSWWPSATVPPRVKPSVSSSTCRNSSRRSPPRR